MSLVELLHQAELQSCGVGQRLLTRGQPLTDITYLVNGSVALGMVQGAHLVHRLGRVSSPAWVELASAVLNLPVTCDAVAETPVDIKRVKLSVFRQWLEVQPLAVQEVMRDLARSQHQLAELSVSRLAMDAQARCADWLLHHAQSGDRESLAVQFTQRKRQIAEQLGIAPETLSRILRDLRERGLIKGRGRVLSLVDPGALRMLAGA
ncbi:MAG: Crp/Fnr family transcriptional regulator [Limnohabitans sp.]|jgi:CRP-like cAMP-binding protein|nr:Crp/Fnr family transcriptional regulator [Limnohabitans sp.]